MSREIVEAKLRFMLSQKVRSWGKGTGWLPVSFPYIGLYCGYISTRGSLIRAHLRKIASAHERSLSLLTVNRCLYYSLFNFTVPTQMCKRQFSLLFYVYSQVNMYTVVGKLSVPFRETQVVLI